MGNKDRSFKTVVFSITSAQFWILLAMFVVGIVFYYPQQVLGINAPSLLSFIGLTRYTVERTLFLVPITYAGMFFGLKTGIASLVISMIIILPRVFLISESPADALLQTGSVAILGVLVNIWFEVRRKESAIYRALVARLEESEIGMSISEQKYRYLFENASDAIWVQDVNGCLVEGNRAFEKLTGLKMADARGVRLAQLMSPESLALAREIRNKLVNGQDFEQPYEQQFRIRPGLVKTVKMSTNAVVSGGRITGFEHIARDVTLEKQQQENVRAYIQRITRVQEEERKRIARDLHDDVSPNILILIQKIDGLISMTRLKLATVREKLQELRGQAVTALESLRATAQGLRPRIIDDLGLAAALEWIAEELEKDQKIAVHVEVGEIARGLTPETQIVLFRIAQEALTNIRKYARASNVSIKVAGGENAVTMTITDDGQGFEMSGKLEDIFSSGRLGIMGMYERARLVNGNLEIKSAPGRGTALIVRLPWTAPKQELLPLQDHP